MQVANEAAILSDRCGMSQLIRHLDARTKTALLDVHHDLAELVLIELHLADPEHGRLDPQRTVLEGMLTFHGTLYGRLK